MAANVETMFTYRQQVWHGLGTILQNIPTSREAIVAAGLDWDVESQPLYLPSGFEIPDKKANIRVSDQMYLGTVGSRYTIVQNRDAFDFTDGLIGEGCVYETAGSLSEGKQIWLLARLPEAMQIAGDDVMPYLCFMNTHDGSSAVTVFSTGVRVCCQNTLNMALKSATRKWTGRHTATIKGRMDEAAANLRLATKYMEEMKKSCEELALKNIDKDKLLKMIEQLLPEKDGISNNAKEELMNARKDILTRYAYAPDLVDREHTMLRFLQAVSDAESHRDWTGRRALKETWKEKRFLNMMTGKDNNEDDLVNKAYQIAIAA